MCEYVDHLHEHFTSPVVIHDAHYMPPKVRGAADGSYKLLNQSLHLKKKKKKQMFLLGLLVCIHCASCSQDPGYSCEMLESSVKKHQYPEGDVWKQHINN